MIYKRYGDKIVIRLLKGDKLVESVQEILNKENVLAGSLTGLGAIDYLDMGVFDPETQGYKKHIFEEFMEVTNLTGIISEMDGKLYTHIHITCGKSDETAVAGHLNEARIGLTSEIVVSIINGKIDRKYDKDLGINIIEF